MFYMRAERDYNGQLQIETLAGLTVDKCEYLDQPEFLSKCANITEQDGCIYGVVSCEVQSVLVSAY